MINSVTIITGEEKKQLVLSKTYEVFGNSFVSTIAPAKPGIYPITVYINDWAALHFQLEVEE